MAITFPRDLPELPGNRLLFNTAEFEPQYQNTVSPFRGGLVQAFNVGADLWAMSFTTVAMDYQQGTEYMAWLHSLRGGLRTFKAWHPLRRYPFAYPNGFGSMTRGTGGAFDGTCTLNAIGVSRDTITLTTLPGNFQFSIGDMVSFPMGGAQCLLRVMEAATANGIGTVTLTVEPFVPLAASAGTNQVTLVKPWCLAVIDAKSIRGPMRPGRYESIEFSAVQTY